MENAVLISSIFSTKYGFQDTGVNGKHYEWQMLFGNQWRRIENDHVIETHYCHPGAKEISINTSQGQVFIDFDKLETRNAAVKVQRLSFLPQGQTEDIGWYFRDDQLWREYGSQSSNVMTSSISSKDIEQHFTLHPRGTLSFTVGSTGYTLDFSTMTQTNHNTNLRRNVRRRPKFNFNTASLPSTPGVPAASPLLLSDGHYKWEFMGDEGQWTEYQSQICSFDSDAIERQYQLNQQGQLHFRTKKFSYTLDFSTMRQVNNDIGTTRAVRRTPDNGSQQSSSSGRTPHWQFQDIGGIWKDYSKGPHCDISSQDIELQYQQNPSGTLPFNTMSYRYEINFSAMTQRNLDKNTTRPVKRLLQ
ncbi:uncharacterized protein PAE49_009528 isoform 2-T3 [Odontesthes bonariensis]|uniref:uncharacterized protein LOC142385287 isoform X2 n=1 Tax=Odontesthes bonariensis TaxID=219752 RepID=UPI003F5884F6